MIRRDHRIGKTPPAAGVPRPARGQRTGLPAARFLALAAGATAIAALGVGAMAIGSLAIGSLAARRARIGRLEIGELTVHRLTILEPEGRRTDRGD